MELLVFLLLTPAIFAQNYQPGRDPNNEPFLPIFPAFPYSPKLMKRGTEKDIATPGAKDSHPSKQDSRDSYLPNFDVNFQKNSYYPAYSSFLKTPTHPVSPFTSPFASPFGSSTFSASPFGSNPFGSPSFPSTSFHPNPYNSLNSFVGAYQNSPLTQPPSTPYPQNSFANYFQTPNFYPNQPNFYNQYPPSQPPPGADYPNRNNDDDDDNRKGKKGGRGRYKEDEDLNDNQFTDGANFLSSNSKDLDGQSSFYKGSYISNLSDNLNGIPGQSATVDYPTTTYIKPHQLEQLMRQALIKLLAQNLGQQTSQVQYPVHDSNLNSPNQITGNNGLSKNGPIYVVNPSVVNKPINPINSGQTQQTQAVFGKSQRFPDSQYQKPQGIFNPSLKTIRNPIPLQSPNYGDFDAQPSQVDQNYQASSNQDQRSNYKSKNLVTQTPQSSSYQYSNYQPTPTPKLSDDRELDNISINFNSQQIEKKG